MNVPGPAMESEENSGRRRVGAAETAGPGMTDRPFACNCGNREFRIWIPPGKRIARIFCARCSTEFGIGFKC